MNSAPLQTHCTDDSNASRSFQHTPLDHDKDSIRLVQILPELSASGLIQCKLTSSTPDTAYVCLSYMWGSTGGKREILINGRVFETQHNLWGFLSAARESRRATLAAYYWIDAICIDQVNTIERNHQVAHMGRIYSQASYVVVWLGTSGAVNRFFEVTHEFHKQAAKDGKLDSLDLGSTWDRFRVADERRFVDDWAEFATHPYWTRAWITQEVELARTLQLWTDACYVTTTQFNAMYFLAFMLPCTLLSKPHNERRLWSSAVKYIANTVHREPPRARLVHLLANYPDRASQIPRDRIYSLIHMATDGHLVPIDYDLADRDFFYDLVVALKATMTCLCCIRLVAHTLQVSGSSSDDGPRFKLAVKASSGYVVDLEDLEDLEDRSEVQRLELPWLVCSSCNNVHLEEEGGSYCLQTLCGNMQGHLFFEAHERLSSGTTTGLLEVSDERTSEAIEYIALGVVQVTEPDDQWLDIYLNISQLVRLTSIAYDNSHDPYHGICHKYSVRPFTLELCQDPLHLDRMERMISPRIAFDLVEDSGDSETTVTELGAEMTPCM